MNKSASNNNDIKKEPEFSYAKEPKRNPELRKEQILDLTTNLLRLKVSENEQKLCLYHYSIEPELANDNFTLYSKIQRQIDSDLNKYFTRKCFSGNNLFASSDAPQNKIELKTNVENVEYKIMLKFIRLMEFEKINDLNDFDGNNQRTKSFLEKIIKGILLKNKNTIKFGDARTIVKINTKNVSDVDPNNNSRESVYHGYFTSAQVTESGLFLLVLNVNKHIRNITVYEKIKELRAEHKNLSESDIRKVIDSYFKIHKTVLTIYGSLRTYRVDSIDFDASPKKTSFNIKDGDKMKTITIEEYFKKQYNTRIMDPNQPLIIAETKSKNKMAQKKDNSGNINLNKNNNEEERIIYLVPELLYITGNVVETDSRNRRAIISKTKMDPNTKMKEINAINELMKSTSAKTYKTRDGKILPSKTPLEVSKEWGISLGDNLRIKGRVFTQPHLIFKGQNIIPRNGKFMSGQALSPVSFDINNFVYIYDSRDKSDIKSCLKLFVDKARNKGIKIDLQLNEIHGVALKDFHNWDDIYKNLKIVKEHARTIKMAIVFLSPSLEKYYGNLKSFFTNDTQFPSQFVVSKKLQDPKRAGSIMFNIVEQINIKMGGKNYYIDFYREKIIPPNKIYMILGLETRQSANGEDLVMTSSSSNNLEKIITSVFTVQNIQQEKEYAIKTMMDLALKALQNSGCPHPPDYVILYRQGGNKFQNKKLANNEVPIFINILKNKFTNFKVRFIYICCNLKSDLKFFERNNISYQNPQSGLCVDSEVVQKGKFEFYIQPQLVNQGTATPCHYEVMYEGMEIEEKGEKKHQVSDIKLEELEKLTFYLTFYYWTWAGAIRVPGALKLASTCMDFYIKHLDRRLERLDKAFVNPEYI